MITAEPFTRYSDSQFRDIHGSGHSKTFHISFRTVAAYVAYMHGKCLYKHVCKGIIIKNKADLDGRPRSSLLRTSG